MVGRIWEMLRLETEAETAVVNLSCFAVRAAIQEVAAVKLNARFGGQYLEHSAGARFHYPRR